MAEQHDTSPVVRIAFTGKMGAGKTTMARYVSDKYGIQVMSLASKVKDVERCMELGGEERQLAIFKHALDLIDDEELKAHNRRSVLATGWNDILKNETNRRTRLQKIGTEVGRKVDELLWVNYLLGKLQKDAPCVIDDVRFVNEAEALRDAGFVIVRLDVPEEERLRRIAQRDAISEEEAASYGNHPSETEVMNILPDAVVDNTNKRSSTMDLDRIVGYIMDGKEVVTAQAQDIKMKVSVSQEGVEEAQRNLDEARKVAEKMDKLVLNVKDFRNVSNSLLIEMYMRHIVNHINMQTIDNGDGTYTHIIEFTENVDGK